MLGLECLEQRDRPFGRNLVSDVLNQTHGTSFRMSCKKWWGQFTHKSLNWHVSDLSLGLPSPSSIGDTVVEIELRRFAEDFSNELSGLLS